MSKKDQLRLDSNSSKLKITLAFELTGNGPCLKILQVKKVVNGSNWQIPFLSKKTVA
jgi:hypothetical protein